MVRPTDFNRLMQKGEFVPQAVFERPISYFAELLKASVNEGHDDLDYYEGVGFLLDDLIPVVAMHYRGHPAGTTTIHLPFEVVDPRLIAAIVGVVAHHFDIPAGAVSWQRQPGGELLAG